MIGALGRLFRRPDHSGDADKVTQLRDLTRRQRTEIMALDESVQELRATLRTAELERNALESAGHNARMGVALVISDLETILEDLDIALGNVDPERAAERDRAERDE